MRKKSSYRPKTVRLDTISFVKSGLIPVTKVKDAGMMLQIKNHAALDAILKGKGTQEDVDTLMMVLNISEALALFRLGNDWLEEIKSAQDAVYNMAKRGLTGKNFIFTGPEMQIVKQIMELHDEQLNNCTVKLLEEAMNYVHARLRNGHAKAVFKEAA